MRYLLLLGLEYAGTSDVQINLPDGEWVRSITRFDDETRAAIETRAEQFQVSVGREVVRLLALAIQVNTNRNIRLLEQLMQPGQQAHALAQTAASEAQPS